MRMSLKSRIGIVKLAGVTLVLIAGQAMGASTVTYTLELGGNNHAADVKAGTYVTFTHGNSADGQYFPPGTPEITWDAKIAASGTHEVGGTPYNIKGVANFVFNLELHEGTADGPLVTTAPFYSSIHDGSSECDPCQRGFCNPCLASAGFALSFNVWSYGPGRVIDAPSYTCSGGSPVPPNGGPNCDVFVYPTNPNDGTLLGIGAGYHHWCKTCGGATWTKEGIGISTGLGIVPVCEGQINTSTLPEGTYVLKLVPRPGTNVLRGDKNLDQNQDAFAIPADNTVEDTITFEIKEVIVYGAHLASAVSRMDHNGTNLDITLPLGEIGSEPRALDTYMNIYLTFSEPVKAWDGAWQFGDEITLTGGTGLAIIPQGADTLWLLIMGSSVQDCVTIVCNKPKILDMDDQPLDANLDNDVQFTVLFGDASPDGMVNAVDLGLVKARLFETVTNDNCNCDLDRDLIINAVDLGIVLDPGVLFTTAKCP